MRYSIYTLSTVLLLSACVNNAEKMQTTDQAHTTTKVNDHGDIKKVSAQEASAVSAQEVKAILEKNTIASEVKEGIYAMQRGDHKDASKLFNSALLDNPSDSNIHFLNGLNYLHLVAAGDSSARELALVGFRYAIVYDPSNVLAHKRLGYMHYQAKEYDKAQNCFAEVLLLQQPDVKMLYALAAASYFNRDLKTAYASITKAVNMAPNNPHVLKAAAMIAAAMNQPLEVQNFRKQYLNVKKTGDSHLDRRLHQWMGVHNNPNLILTAADAGAGDAPPPPDAGADAPPADLPPPDAGAPPPDPGAPPSDGLAGVGGGTAATPMAKKLGAYDPKNPDTFVIDCAIMKVSETGNTSKGNNILNTINVVFNPGTYTSTRSWKNSGIKNGGSDTRAFNQSFGLAQAGTYSLNIFNVTDNRVEVVARPTLLAAIGKISEFFAGTDLIANVASQASGNSIERLPVGYRVTVTPVGSRKDKDGVLKIQFDVRLEGNTIGNLEPIAGSASVTPTNYSRINHSSVSTTVELAFGETVILAGIYDREDNASKDKTPGLGDIPGIGLFFSKETTESVRKSVVYMMTLRPTEKMQEDANMLNDGKRLSPEIRELQMKNISWFSTVPNSALIMKGLSKIYREFRTGDMPPINWSIEDLADKKVEGSANNEIGEVVKMMDS
jgi:tetratricopeptide (TPR) repeat protein